MKRANRQLNVFDELIVDNFAGGGGASTGIERALGRTIDIAINHDPEAVAMHQANHPFTKHYCESVWDVDPVEVCEGRPVGLAWFSPDCKHFSKAKGGKPRDKNIRGLAWVAIRWAATVRPRVIILENVEEFQTWGPLVNGEPCKERKGQFFRAFINKFKKLLYAVEFKEVIAYEHGAPTTRKRFVLIARCDGQPIVWPEPTHGKPSSEGVKSGRLSPWRTAAEIIDWSLPCPSIFERKRPLAEATLRRIARGIKKFVIDAKKPFIVTCNHQGDGFRGQDLDKPFKTVTCSRDADGLIVPTLIQTSYGERPGQEPRVPGLDKPLGTVVAQGIKHALIAPTLIQMAIPQEKDAPPRCMDVDKPLGTVMAVAIKHGLAVANLLHYRDMPGEKPRDVELDEPLQTITAGGVTHALEVVSLLQHNAGKQALDPGPGANVPMSTITAKNNRSVVCSSLIKLRGTNVGSCVESPVPTLTAGGTHIGEVRAFLDIYNGNNAQGQCLNEPSKTVTASDRMSLITIESVEYIIVDIGMRMLKPHELFAAQGFPPDYQHAPMYKGKPLTQTAQVKMCGNSVPPPMAEAIVRANFAQPMRKEKRA